MPRKNGNRKGGFADRSWASNNGSLVVQYEPDEAAKAVGDCAEGFVVAQARYQTTIENLEDAPFLSDGSIGTLVENAAHVAVTFRRAFAAGMPALFSSPGHAPTQETSFLVVANVVALAPNSAMICCAESTPKSGASASR